MTNKFTENEVICFLGDSITSDGRWISEIYETIKQDKIRVFNCGIAGTTAGDGLARIYNDCLNFSPNHVVIMFGLNDVGLEFYNGNNSEELEEKRTKKLKDYENNMTQIIEICQKVSNVILMTPTPYDETNEQPENLMKNDAVSKASNIVKKLAEKYKLPLVDTNKTLNDHIPDEIISPDRVHPNAKGHRIIAQTFMSEIGLIDNFDIESTFTISPENKKRIKFTEMYRAIQFVEFYVLKPQTQNKKIPIEDKKQILKQMLSTVNPYNKKMIEQYLKNIDFKDDIISEMVKHTIYS